MGTTAAETTMARATATVDRLLGMARSPLADPWTDALTVRVPTSSRAATLSTPSAGTIAGTFDDVTRRDTAVAVFMIERRYADQLEVTADSAEGINRINDEEGVRWLYSFLSADKRKTYCLYEAASADAIVRAAQRAGLPADVIVEVTDMIGADGSMSPVAQASRP
jgi:Protein of unknown function (DUF4242)